MLLQAAVGHETAVARKNLRLRERWRIAVFVWVAEDELAGFEQPTGAGRWLVAATLDDRLREPVAKAEVIVRVVERRSRLKVERGKHFHAWASREVLVVLRHAAVALRDIARKEDHDGVKVRAVRFVHPVFRRVRPRIAQHLRTGHHALLELFWKSLQRGFVHAEGAQSIQGEGHGDPTIVGGHRLAHRLR